ncbi:MAG TPA: hypothetical protein PKH39_02765 [Woeseiaceae bacterium]|nr:hypothetical protein [Woeseiaceae bacterium]
MKRPRLRTFLVAPVVLFALFYTGVALLHAFGDRSVPASGTTAWYPETIVIFGASGTAGDGILKATLAEPAIRTIHVITRRETPRIRQGIESGKVQMTLHTDYLDYSAIRQQVEGADAVYWAIGTSTFGVDEKTYGMIHVDFPSQFVREWLSVSRKSAISFHYISSSDISADSSAMWAREKVRAEQALWDISAATKLRVVFYRPDYIGPTAEQAHIGQNLLYWFFAPVNAAVRAKEIGQAMIEVSGRGQALESGTTLNTGKIIRYSKAYEQRKIH